MRGPGQIALDERRGGFSRRALLAGLAATGLSACAEQSKVREQGGLIVGSTATGVPFSFIDVRTNSLTGAMVDIARAVAGQAGMPVDLQITPFSALIPSLTAGKIDMIAAAMLRTPEREEVVAFSNPVYAYGGAIVVGADDRSPRQLSDLIGRRVGAQVGTRFVDQLTAAGVKDLRTYDSLADILRDLRLGRLDACYGDEPILRYYLRVTETKTLRLAPDYRPPGLEDVCLVVRKDQPQLLSRLNAAIEQTKAVQIAAIIGKWGL